MPTPPAPPTDPHPGPHDTPGVEPADAPTPTRQHAEALVAHWRANALIDERLAGRLLGDLPADLRPDDGAEDDAAEDDQGLPGWLAAAAELAGYLGAALVAGAAAVLLDVASWANPAQVVLLVLVAAAAGWQVVSPTLLPGADPRGTSTLQLQGWAARLRLALGLLAWSCATTAAALVAELACAGTCTEPSDLGWAVVAAAALAGAAVLYRHVPGVVAHLVLAGSTLWTVLATTNLVAPASLLSGDWQAHTLLSSSIVAVVAVAWIAASERGVLAPAWLGTFGASVALLSAVAVGSEAATSLLGWHGPAIDDAAVLACLAVAVALAAAGVLARRWRLQAVACVALLWLVPATLTMVLGLSTRATAAVLLPAGIGLLAWLAHVVRRR